ncbi:MAG: hypothetical protein ABIX01_12610 [Chitinophagaceae bacterium]
MSGFYSRFITIFLLTVAFTKPVLAQDSSFTAKHAAMLFPYPMYHEKWRASIGFTLLTTSETVTEEVRARVPCGDFRVLRKITNNINLNGRLMVQVLQNHISAGIKYTRPITSRIYAAAGNDLGYWFGILKIQGFNSRASGLINYPYLTVGYKTKNNLLLSFKAEVSLILNYKAVNGENTFTSKQDFYNGESFTLAIEQPFFKDKHLLLAISTINNYFYWQTWSLFYKTNRKVFYPQITVGLIL